MSHVICLQPMSEMVTLRDAMDRLVDEALTRPWSQAEGGRCRTAPSVDMFETGNEVVIKATLPGLKAEEVDITVTGEMLTIRGDFKEEAGSQDKAYHIRQQRWGSLECSISLATAIVADKARAEFENGIPTVTLPKADEVKPKTITVKPK